MAADTFGIIIQGISMVDNKIRVLLVEDNEPDVKLISRMLRQVPESPYRLTVVNHLELAIKKLHRLKYEIILLDLGLPDSKGLSTFTTLHSECPLTPIIIFTILGDETKGIEAISLGAQDYLVKGTSDERILSKSIRYAIERNRLEIEQHRVREELKESDERYRNIFSNAAMGIVEYDSKYNFVAVNDYVCQILGYTREEILGKNVVDITAPQDRELTITNNAMIQEGKINRFSYEKRYLRRDIIPVWAHVTVSAIRDSEGHHVLSVGTIEEITESKKTEEALKGSRKDLEILNQNLENTVEQRTNQVRSLSAALTFAEQRERKRFSYILHEGLQQKLLGAKILLNLHAVDHKALKDDSGQDDLADGIALLNIAIQISRTLSLELNPPILNTEGLDSALRWLSTHMLKSYNLEIDLQMNGPVDQIKGEPQMLLTNMIRELLSNIVKHSGVMKAFVNVTCENKQIRIRVRDEGIGFDVQRLEDTPQNEIKFGLFSIRQKLSLLGGQLQIESKSGLGTICEIFYPYPYC